MEEVEYRSVIKFLVLRKLSPNEILQQLQEVYKESCPSRTTVYYWIREFRGGRQTVFTDTSKSGRPTEIPAAKEEECAALIRENRHIRIDVAADILRVSHGTVSNLLSNLGVKKLCSRLVPEFITSEMSSENVRKSIRTKSTTNSGGARGRRWSLLSGELPLPEIENT